MSRTLSLYRSLGRALMLGDSLKAALERIGVTEARVSAWLGKPCGCDERRAKLNALHWWAQQAAKAPAEKAAAWLPVPSAHQLRPMSLLRLTAQRGRRFRSPASQGPPPPRVSLHIPHRRNAKRTTNGSSTKAA